MSQCDRILAALKRGPVTPVDFAAPNVIDGGKPIMRVAARIYDLRQQGHEITERILPGEVVATYTLATTAHTGGNTTPPVAARPSAPEGSLFDSGEYRHVIRYGEAA